MKEHPLLLKGPLVRATLEGRKTQTRRPVQPWLGRNPPLWSRLIDQDGKPDFDWGELLYYGQDEDSLRHGFGFDDSGHGCPENDAWLTSPIGQVGDRLWVRETWTAAMHDPKGPADCLYRADDNRGELTKVHCHRRGCPDNPQSNETIHFSAIAMVSWPVSMLRKTVCIDVVMSIIIRRINP